jgi:hypothetical protein
MRVYSQVEGGRKSIEGVYNTQQYANMQHTPEGGKKSIEGGRKSIQGASHAQARVTIM